MTLMIEYWNGAAGQKWVDQSNRLDGMLASVMQHKRTGSRRDLQTWGARVWTLAAAQARSR